MNLFRISVFFKTFQVSAYSGGNMEVKPFLWDRAKLSTISELDVQVNNF